jgi:hypothetical protein
MAEEEECCCPEKHQGHICVLKGKGLTRKVERLTGAPGVACLTCGAEADSEDHVCAPVPLFV